MAKPPEGRGMAGRAQGLEAIASLHERQATPAGKCATRITAYNARYL